MAGTIFPSILPDAADRDAFDVGTDTNTDDAGPDIEVLLAEGICPWCEVDEHYENVASHASQAHESQWHEWKGNEE